jgi:hypothetical protein
MIRTSTAAYRKRIRGGFSSLMQKWLLRFALHVRSDRIPGKRIARTRPARPRLPASRAAGRLPARSRVRVRCTIWLFFFLTYLLTRPGSPLSSGRSPGSNQAGRTRDRRTTHCKSRGERRSLGLLGCTHRKARCRPGIGHAVKRSRCSVQKRLYDRISL